MNNETLAPKLVECVMPEEIIESRRKIKENYLRMVENYPEMAEEFIECIKNFKNPFGDHQPINYDCPLNETDIIEFERAAREIAATVITK